MKKETAKSKPRQRLFKAGEIFHGNIELNFLRSKSDQFPAYASAFHRAANQLTNQFEELSAGEYRDTIALPIVFLYRHSLELYIKGILLVGEKILLIKGKKHEVDINIMGHPISKFIPSLRIIFEDVGWTGDTGVEGVANLKEIEKLIIEIDKIDPKSTAFRYPNAKLPKDFCFSIIDFSKLMEKLLDVLQTACIGLEAIFDGISDGKVDYEILVEKKRRGKKRRDQSPT